MVNKKIFLRRKYITGTYIFSHKFSLQLSRVLGGWLKMFTID